MMGETMAFNFQAVIFDLDGVITDTAEYHFLAWKKLADEEGLPFTRADNEALRGVSRRDSLDLLLKGRPISEQMADDWMARKNGYYREMLTSISPQDLLPGVEALLDALRAAGVRTAIASASRNAPQVVERLGLRRRIDVLAHGGSVRRQKPAPDLFLYAAEQLGLPPAACLVVEDAAAGIEAAHAAGMPAVGLGPGSRVGAADLVRPDLKNSSLVDLGRAAAWRVSEPVFAASRQHHRETIFTQGNGYLSTRGTFEERFPGDRQATLVHGIWDDVPIAITELANAPDWTALEILVNGQRFDMQAGNSSHYARWLDLRSGLLQRRLVWEPEAGCSLEIVFERFPSLADEHLLASRLRITALRGQADITIRAQFDSHVENQGLLHWEMPWQESGSDQFALAVRTRRSRKVLALAAKISAFGGDFRSAPNDCPGCPGVRLDGRLVEGQTLQVEKIAALFTSRETEDPPSAAREKVAQAQATGFNGLLEAQRSAWASFWQASDVIIEGDNEAQLALRHALFQLRSAAPAHDERVSIGAKTLSGFGYRGHVFWDNEIFVLPFFTFTQPDIARNMLMYRRHALPGARRKAAANGWEGAQFPWESAETGDEVTPTWVPHFDDPKKLVRIWTGDIQIHISADIAYAMHQYWQASGDDDFWRTAGCRVLLETAVFWGSRAESEGERFAIRDVIGPDENHDHVDNNQFTNHMVRWHLQTALEALDWLRERFPIGPGSWRGSWT
jgi:kojibiose phosphorylase